VLVAPATPATPATPPVPAAPTSPATPGTPAKPAVIPPGCHQWRQNQNALAVAKTKQAICAATIEANKPTLDSPNLVGGGGPALANINTALANIQAVCK